MVFKNFILDQGICRGKPKPSELMGYKNDLWETIIITVSNISVSNIINLISDINGHIKVIENK